MIIVIIDYHRQHDPHRGSLHHPGLQHLVRGDDQEVRELRGRHRERHRQGGRDRPQGVFHAGDGRDDHSDGDDGLFMQMFTAQFGIWLSWAIWVGLTVFALLKLCRYHQQENIRVSTF